MHPFYFETRFRITKSPSIDSFLSTSSQKPLAIISAYATTGETWPEEKNLAEDQMLSQSLTELGLQVARIEGYSPTTGHCEPGWIGSMSLAAALELGRSFKQDAIYWIEKGELYVISCDADLADSNSLLFVDFFHARIDFVEDVCA
jgi:hypothetical protein